MKTTKATVINNIIFDNTTALAIQKEYKKLWECKELQQIIKGTINIVISKIISFKFVDKDEIISALYIYFCKQVDDYTPIYNGGLIAFRAYIITKLQVLQRYPSALGYNIVDFGKKYEEIPSSCVKLASQGEDDIDSLANLSNGELDKYTLEDNKKVILELIAKNDFLNEKEKDILKNYVIYDIERQIDYKRKFKANAAQCFFDMRNRLRNNPHALDELLDYLYNYDYIRKNKKIEEIVSDKGTKTSTRQYRKRLLCTKPDGTKVTYNSMFAASKALGMSYNAVRNLANANITDSKSGITFQLIN